ncbi:hypothetical protein SAMN05216571_10826 [Onishia taeanensis]|uniref:Uncharacterized protein n=1 Tax=Onishia taeanensis TaxID=284577 RepID=A0A1G7SXR7_9GAMM|nr:hypothetical protein [Halomonas taeanensis]SDG27574.1 hypothetical protein SAMN05216571_10826 [Halomonas taeanensis]
MNDRLYLVRDPKGRVHPFSSGLSQGAAVQRFVSDRAGRPVRRPVAWLVWLNDWRRGYRVVFTPAIPQKELNHGR